MGDVLGNYVDARGRVIASPESGRLIGLSLDDLRRIETVIAVVSEAEKPPAILGVLRAGVVDVLIVDEGNARAVLGMAAEEGSGASAQGGRRRPATATATKEVVGSTAQR